MKVSDELHVRQEFFPELFVVLSSVVWRRIAVGTARFPDATR
jgi:hypothetical protein